MCRNITTLRGLEPEATPEEIEAAARQYVRKISGVQKTSERTEAAFEKAVQAHHAGVGGAAGAAPAPPAAAEDGPAPAADRRPRQLSGWPGTRSCSRRTPTGCSVSRPSRWPRRSWPRWIAHVLGGIVRAQERTTIARGRLPRGRHATARSTHERLAVLSNLSSLHALFEVDGRRALPAGPVRAAPAARRRPPHHPALRRQDERGVHPPARQRRPRRQRGRLRVGCWPGSGCACSTLRAGAARRSTGPRCTGWTPSGSSSTSETSRPTTCSSRRGSRTSG